jgi:hypothetical protein
LARLGPERLTDCVNDRWTDAFGITEQAPSDRFMQATRFGIGLRHDVIQSLTDLSVDPFYQFIEFTHWRNYHLLRSDYQNPHFCELHIDIVDLQFTYARFRS